MTLEKVILTELKENPKNVRFHGEKQIKEFVRSIEQFGVIRPVVIDENNMILVGHGLKLALQSMGKEEVDAYRVSNLTEGQKDKLMLADNKIYSLGSDDFDAIDKILSETKDFDIPGYDSEDLKALYGSQTTTEQLDKFKLTQEEVEERIEKNKTVAQPSQALTQEKNEHEEKLQGGQNLVLCPNCGEKIFLND
jgi:ParB-like chromosome segregation protein Spo0J